MDEGKTELNEYRVTIDANTIIKVSAARFRLDNHNNLWFYDDEDGWSVRNAAHWVSFYDHSNAVESVKSY